MNTGALALLLKQMAHHHREKEEGGGTEAPLGSEHTPNQPQP